MPLQHGDKMIVALPSINSKFRKSRKTQHKRKEENNCIWEKDKYQTVDIL
jgi:hypothetical protein